MNPNVVDNIDVKTVIVIILAIGWLLERILKYTKQQKSGLPTWGEVKKELEKKVNVDSCTEFRTRIGGESTEHRKNIMEIKNHLSEIKGGVEYLKGKVG